MKRLLSILLSFLIASWPVAATDVFSKAAPAPQPISTISGRAPPIKIPGGQKETNEAVLTYMESLNKRLQDAKKQGTLAKEEEAIREELKGFYLVNIKTAGSNYVALNEALFGLRIREVVLKEEIDTEKLLSVFPKEKQDDLIKYSGNESYALHQEVVDLFPPERWKETEFRKSMAEKGYKPTGDAAKNFLEQAQQVVNNKQTGKETLETTVTKPEESKAQAILDEMEKEDAAVEEEVERESGPEIEQIERENPPKAKQLRVERGTAARQERRQAQATPKPTVVDRSAPASRPEEKGFFQKYWPYLLGIGLFFLLTKEKKKPALTMPAAPQPVTGPVCKEMGGNACNRLTERCTAELLTASDVTVQTICCSKPCEPPLRAPDAEAEIRSIRATDPSKLGFGLKGPDATIITPFNGGPPEQDLRKLNSNTDRVLPGWETLYVLNGNATNMYTLSGNNHGVENRYGIFFIDHQGTTKISVAEKTGAAVIDGYGTLFWLAPGTTTYHSDTDSYEIDTTLYHYESGLVLKPIEKKIPPITGAAVTTPHVRFSLQKKETPDNGVDASYNDGVWTLTSAGSYDAELIGKGVIPYAVRNSELSGHSSVVILPKSRVTQSYLLSDKTQTYAVSGTKIFFQNRAIQDTDATPVKELSPTARRLLEQ